jgi:alanine racemase
MLFSELENIAHGTILRLTHDEVITDLVTDSRKAIPGPGAVFFAIAGPHHDGHAFISR